MDDGDSSNEDADGKFDFHQSLIFPCFEFFLLFSFLFLLHLRITRIDEYMFSYGGDTSWRDLRCRSVQMVRPTTRTTSCPF